MNKAIKCSYCKKCFIDVGQTECPYCKKSIKEEIKEELPDFIKDIFR